MSNHRIGSLVILRGTTPDKDKKTLYNNPIGITTERDIVTHLGSKIPWSIQTPMLEIMRPPHVQFSPIVH
jgi:CBS domain-containing protein